MTKQKPKRSRAIDTDVFDGVYLLKLTLYVILGSLWIKAGDGLSTSVGIPIGLVVGLLFTTHEHFRIDRKIEYALLVAAAMFGYFAPYGLYVIF